MEGSEIKITYHPREIIKYIEKKGFFTLRDLIFDFEYNEIEATWILSDLERLRIVNRPKDNDYEYIEETKTIFPKHYLTEKGKDIGKWPEVRRAVFQEFPVFSKVGVEQTNYILESLRVRGISLEEMMKLNSPELEELIKKSRVDILKNLSPENLRQLAKEIKEMRKDIKP